jgi:hypothetical protein
MNTYANYSAKELSEGNFEMIEISEDGIIGRDSYFRKRSFTQQPVRRSNGDTVFITAGDGAVVQEVRRQLMQLARKHSLPMIVISELAKVAATKQQEKALRAELAAMEEEGEWIIPEPEAEVNLALAAQMYRRDVLRCAEVGNDLEALAEASQCQYSWTRFWAARHPSPEGRAEFAAMLAEMDVLRAKTKAKADFLIARANRQ